MAAATPRYMATPPPRGVGMTCTSRSRGAAIIRQRTATIRTTGVARKVTRPAVSRTTAYSRMVPSDGPREVGVGGTGTDQQLVQHDAGDVRVEGGQGVEVRAPVRDAHRGAPEASGGASGGGGGGWRSPVPAGAWCGGSPGSFPAL